MSAGAVIWPEEFDALNIGAVHVLVQRAHVGERDAGRGHRAPQRGGGVHHGRGLRVGDGARERALVDVVVHLAAGPVHRLAREPRH